MNDTFMKEKPVLPLILSMSLPMVLSMLVNSLYNIVDSFFVAQISEEAMTALSLVYPVQNFINAAGIGFGVGINAVIAFYLGAGNHRKALPPGNRQGSFTWLPEAGTARGLCAAGVSPGVVRLAFGACVEAADAGGAGNAHGVSGKRHGAGRDDAAGNSAAGRQPSIEALPRSGACKHRGKQKAACTVAACLCAVSLSRTFTQQRRRARSARAARSGRDGHRGASHRAFRALPARYRHTRTRHMPAVGPMACRAEPSGGIAHHGIGTDAFVRNLANHSP